MSREILFRGKHIHTLPQNEHLDGTWVYGYLSDENHINSPEEGEFLVDSETVCQYTGLTDKNDRKIFEGDIVDCSEKRGAAFWHCKVVWNDVMANFNVTAMDCTFPMCLDDHDISINGLDYEVIGNIFDNPELVETTGNVAKPKCDECKCNSCFYKSDCCPDCEGAIRDCEEYSETDVYLKCLMRIMVDKMLE